MRIAICPSLVHFRGLARHFLALTAGDRSLRFGRVINDVDLVAYVEALFVRADTVFVVVEPARDIAGAVHVEFTDRGANLGLSVSAAARGQGIGTLLLERAARFAGSRCVSTLFVRNLGSNMPLRRLARGIGMKVACAPDSWTTQLERPVESDGAIVGESLAGRITLADYSLRSWRDSRPAFDPWCVDPLEPMPS